MPKGEKEGTDRGKPLLGHLLVQQLGPVGGVWRQHGQIAVRNQFPQRWPRVGSAVDASLQGVWADQHDQVELVAAQISYLEAGENGGQQRESAVNGQHWVKK
jgi:hypothetical protein